MLIERKSPFSPSQVISEFAGTIRAYHCSSVIADKYAGDFPKEIFASHQVRYEPSERTKSEIYAEFLPLLNSSSVDLLDNDRMVLQFCNLERKNTSSGRPIIEDTGTNTNDDVCNAAAGACVLAAEKGTQINISRESAAQFGAAMSRLGSRTRIGGPVLGGPSEPFCQPTTLGVIRGRSF